MEKTPITKLIDFINDTAVTKDISDEVKEALSGFSEYITNYANELIQEEKQLVIDVFEEGKFNDKHPEEFFNETFEQKLKPIVMNEKQFKEYSEALEK
tara:strand:- start:37200 stop:37493 length:294 start_codon:yes stop_codon:yes gene_type:complete